MKVLREDLGEASNRIRMVAGDVIPTIEEAPIFFASDPNASRLLEFHRNHFNNDGNIEYEILCQLNLQDSVLTYTRELSAGNAPDFMLSPRQIILSDVQSVDIEARKIVHSISTGYEYVLDGAISDDEEQVGTMLKVSIFVAPPENIILGQPIIETFNRKLFVRAVPF